MALQTDGSDDETFNEASWRLVRRLFLREATRMYLSSCAQFCTEASHFSFYSGKSKCMLFFERSSTHRCMRSLVSWQSLT